MSPLPYFLEANSAEMQLSSTCVLTLKLCTLFVKVAVADLGIELGKLAALILRDVETDFKELSWLEKKVKSCGASSNVANWDDPRSETMRVCSSSCFFHAACRMSNVTFRARMARNAVLPYDGTAMWRV